MEAAHEDAEIIFGTVIDESMKDAVKVTVIATGLNSAEAAAGINQFAGAAALPPQPNAAMLSQFTQAPGGRTGRGSSRARGSSGCSGFSREDSGSGTRRSRRFRRAVNCSDRFQLLGHGIGSSGWGC